MPHWTVFGVPLNPGPFNVKEHVVITVMATVGSTSAYAVGLFLPLSALAKRPSSTQTGIIAVQRFHYNQRWPFSYQWLLVMSTQLIGFSLGGTMKRFLVSPPSMSKPQELSVALSKTDTSMRDFSLAFELGLLRSSKHTPLTGLFWIWTPFRDESRAVLLVQFLRGCCLVYVPLRKLTRSILD